MLARDQFGLNIGFRRFFASLTISRGAFLWFFWVRDEHTQHADWFESHRPRGQVFVLSFAMHAVAGRVISLPFATN